MRTNSDAGFYLFLAYVGVILVGAIGWVSNIVKLIGAPSLELTGFLVGRIIGVFVFPLGAVLGYF